MWITQGEAVVMFARYCRARFGKSAARRVRAKAKALEKRGDIKGHEIWDRVAAELEKKTQPRSDFRELHQHLKAS